MNTNENIRVHLKNVRPTKEHPIEWRRWGVIFLRSTHWTDDLPTQEVLCRQFCEKNNIEVAHVYQYLGDDVAEPAEIESWGIAPILEDFQEHEDMIDVLVVAGRDRLGTNTADYLRCVIDLLKEGVEILSVTDIESADSSMEEICEIVAKYEKDSHVEEANKIV